MNRTLKEATVNRYHYDGHEQLRAHFGWLRHGLQLRSPAQDPERALAL